MLCTLEYFAHHKMSSQEKLVRMLFRQARNPPAKGTYQLVDEDNIRADYAVNGRIPAT